MDAGLAVEAGGVRVGAVQAPRHASSPLLLQQLRHDRLHSLRGLQWKISTIRVKIFFIDTKHNTRYLNMQLYDVLPRSPARCLDPAPPR